MTELLNFSVQVPHSFHRETILRDAMLAGKVDLYYTMKGLSSNGTHDIHVLMLFSVQVNCSTVVEVATVGRARLMNLQWIRRKGLLAM